MTITPLTLDEVRDIYHQRMVDDFPRNERKSFNMIESALREGNYACYGYKEGSDILAYAFFVVLGQNCLLDYFAVDSARRGTGIGGRFLRELCGSVLKDAQTVLLEVEDPGEARNDEDRAKRERRLRFYERQGMINTGVRANVFWADFLILRMPVGMPEPDVREVYQSFYRSILPPLAFKTMVQMKQ